jgi:hypothetical protein
MKRVFSSNDSKHVEYAITQRSLCPTGEPVSVYSVLSVVEPDIYGELVRWHPDPRRTRISFVATHAGQSHARDSLN